MKTSASEWVLISCPVYKREWILPHWFAAIEAQDWDLTDVGFQFLVAPHGDPETLDALMMWAQQHPEVRCFDVIADTSNDHVPHLDRGPGKRRQWNSHRYTRMAAMRNELLDRAICRDPDRFFSLDSDIILECPSTLSQLVELTEDRAAVAPLCFMVPPTVPGSAGFPNFMSWRREVGGAAFRPPAEYAGVERKDVIMAAVMMNRQCYTTSRYQHHLLGEDLGWSADCAKRGLDLWCASNLYAAHVMYPDDLDTYLKIGDPRGVAKAV